ETELLLERMVTALRAMGVRKILLSVSPVPMEMTFSGKDCAVANVYSKSVLVAGAESIRRRHAEVDYFPGYEIAMSAGSELYESDLIHVRDEFVELITSYLIDHYVKELRR